MSGTFGIGDRVRVRLGNPDGHCRIPEYLRGRRGRIVATIGAFPLADRRARGEKPAPEAVYTVSFEATDVWGTDAAAGDSIVADLWETYLEVPA